MVADIRKKNAMSMKMNKKHKSLHPCLNRRKKKNKKQTNSSRIKTPD